MAVAARRKFVLDTNCFIDASRSDGGAAALAEFSAWAAPDSISVPSWQQSFGQVRQAPGIGAFWSVSSSHLTHVRGRLLNPSAAAWEALGTTLAALVEEDGLALREVRRSFVFDILIARSCREIGATLVSRNSTDLSRIDKVFAFDFVAPYPIQAAD